MQHEAIDSEASYKTWLLIPGISADICHVNNSVCLSCRIFLILKYIAVHVDCKKSVNRLLYLQPVVILYPGTMLDIVNK